MKISNKVKNNLSKYLLLGFLDSYYVPKKLLVGIFLMLICSWMALGPNVPYILAANLPITEQQALNEWTNWVASSCSGSSSGSSSGPALNGGVSFNDSQSSDTGGVTTIDDDGIDPSPTHSPDHQSSTSYANGKLGALHTNYFALNPGWASANGLALGDIGALTYKGKTIYAVYGDNHTGNTPHAEISVAATMALTGITDPTQAESSISGVHFIIYPGTHQQLGGSVDQSKIDQIGAQASGGGAAAGSSSGSSSTGSCCNQATTFGPGSLPSSVPDPYNSIFTAASSKYDIAPALLAGIFYGGEHGNSFPDPPAPYGHGSPWASSGVASPGGQDWPTQPPGPGAAGPFQFEYPTWQKYGVNANGKGGAPDVEDLTDAAFGAANYLAASGAKGVTDKASLSNAIMAYNHSQAYVDSVLAAYQKFGGTFTGTVPTGAASTPVSGGCSGPTNSNFTNPFPDGWNPNRLDMGYDGGFTNKIVSPCAGKMIYVDPDSDHSDNGGWKGAYFVVQCTQSIPDLPSNAFYFAEGVSPTVSKNDTVTAGQQIGVPGWTGYSEGPGGIEWGIADPNNPGNTLAESGVSGFTNCSSASKSMVLAFAKWAELNFNIAPPSSTDHAGCA